MSDLRSGGDILHLRGHTRVWAVPFCVLFAVGSGWGAYKSFVVIYALRLADVLGIDLSEAVEAKVGKNASRYSVDGSFGRADKR